MVWHGWYGMVHYPWVGKARRGQPGRHRARPLAGWSGTRCPRWHSQSFLIFTPKMKNARLFKTRKIRKHKARRMAKLQEYKIVPLFACWFSPRAFPRSGRRMNGPLHHVLTAAACMHHPDHHHHRHCHHHNHRQHCHPPSPRDDIPCLRLSSSYLQPWHSVITALYS